MSYEMEKKVALVTHRYKKVVQRAVFGRVRRNGARCGRRWQVVKLANQNLYFSVSMALRPSPQV